jgi:hypothetical protein
MSADLSQVKRRGALVAALCGVAFLAAVAGFVFYFKFGQQWARLAAIAALIVGFGAQTWFIFSLRRAGRGV